MSRTILKFNLFGWTFNSIGWFFIAVFWEMPELLALSVLSFALSLWSYVQLLEDEDGDDS